MDLKLNHDHYPPFLRQVHSPPKVLHIRGSLLDCDRFAVAMVGSRNATFYGLRVAEQLAYDLAERGITIVSGLARGIDAASHKGALKAGGRTIAVLGSSLDKIYPKEHEKLAGEIAKQGCVISQFPNGTEAWPGNFPLRNRIISGLSLGVIVVEASRKSGSLITASHAAEQGRQVFAVPGPVDSLLSEGAHSLIKDGAKLVESAEDILAELAPMLKDMLPKEIQAPRQCSSSAEAQLNTTEKSIMEVLEDGPLQSGDMADILGCAEPEIREALVKLEVGGNIKRLFGGTYEIAEFPSSVQ
ncbi:MAG: DNA-protecting protein DprA [Candidatus Omnitrophica bacterium]|nr:DNA-protecting protein DprA [Candidatus Omnitrophota bacterium]